MNKKLVLWALFIILLIIFLTPGVYANYQSIETGNSLNNVATIWITGIRQMESSGQGMGLSEEIDTTTALATTESNNIDVHLLKNTEYGAILLLGASDYGKQGSSIDDRRMDRGSVSGTAVQASTTGNRYGIYEMGYNNMTPSNKSNAEWTAGGGTEFLTNIAKRYRNIYESATERAGEATKSTSLWHGSNAGSSATYVSGYIRGAYGAFSYATSPSGNNYTARAAVVCGTGL